MEYRIVQVQQQYPESATQMLLRLDTEVNEVLRQYPGAACTGGIGTFGGGYNGPPLIAFQAVLVPRGMRPRPAAMS